MSIASYVASAIVIVAIIIFIWENFGGVFSTTSLKSSGKSISKSRNEDYINLAIKHIEELYIAGTKLKRDYEIEGHITMWQEKKEDDCAYCIQLNGYGWVYFGNEDYFREKYDLDWGGIKINNNEKDEEIRIEIFMSGEIFGEWDYFNQTVWNELHSKHPDWSIRKVYPYKSVVNF